MAFINVPLAALIAVFLLCIYRLIVVPLFLSPLSRIPTAHWSSSISPAWILYLRWAQQDNAGVHAAHERQGPIVRLGPNELSINCVDGGIRTVYAGGYEKGDWYSNLFTNYGVMPMFAMPEKGPHSQRKRMLSNIYAKSVLQTSVPLAEVSNLLLNQRLVPRLQQVAKSGQPLEMYDLVSAATMDFVTCYIFGLTKGSNFLQDPKRCGRFLRDYKARQKYTFWPQEVAGFTKAMSKVGLGSLLVPSWVNKANSDIEAWILSMCDGAEETLQQENTEQNADYPTVYAQLRNTMMKETEKMDLEMNVQELVDRQRIEVASEMLDHALAGFDTSGITLTYLSWELSRSSEWQQRLRTELHEVENFEPKEIDALPVLNAILMETLRLHAAIPGGQPRMTPPNATLGDFTGLPAGVRVNAQAYSLHRNEEVFPEAEEWRPQRWLEATEEQQKQMGRWFWAFGSGGRMCVGSNFAIQEMKAIIASIWSRFQTTVVDDQGMVHNGSYIAEPIGSKEGHYLLLEVKELSA